MQSDPFRAAAESKDFSAFEEIFAGDVSFRSPAVFKPYEGRDAVAMLLATVADVFEDFRYTDQAETGATAMLAFSARVGDRELEGIDLLRFDGEGRVREMAVYIRPLSGLNALAGAIQRKLEAPGEAP
jgi:hypothetical protein